MMKENGLTKKEWREWEKKVKDNPPKEYEQSEKYKDYEYRKSWHVEKLAREFLKEKGKRHF